MNRQTGLLRQPWRLPRSYGERETPGTQVEDCLSDQGSKSRGYQDDCNNDRQSTRQSIPAVSVTEDRSGNDAWCGGTEAPNESNGLKKAEARGESGGYSRDDVEDQAKGEDRLAAESIRERAINQLAHTPCAQEDRDDGCSRCRIVIQAEMVPHLARAGSMASIAITVTALRLPSRRGTHLASVA